MNAVTQFRGTPKGMTLTQLATELERQRTAKRDFLIPSTKDLTVTSDNGLRVGIGAEEFPINQHALRQMGTRLDIPAKYVDRLAQKYPDMLAYNLNELFRREPERRVVRVLDGTARAYVSDKFRLDLDNYEFANVVLPQLLKNRCTVTSCQITETKMYIKAYRPDVVRQYSKVKGAYLGDGGHNKIHVFRPGLVISNSEVGDGAQVVDNGIHEEGCSNLLIWSLASLRRFHVGRAQTVQDGWEIFSDETKKISAEAALRQMQDLVQATLEDLDMFNRQVDEVIAKMEGTEIAKPSVAVRELPNTTEAEQEGILAMLIKGGDLSQYGMQAAVTEFAQSESVSYTRQVELERLGGKIIELPKTEWEEIALAA